ncbi:MAG: hypothetical protein V4773_19395, partial [Verrucomicrobiota bacterium]
PILLRAILGDDLNAALHAARTLELAGEPTRSLLPQLRSRLAAAQARAQKSYLEFYISMSLGSLIAALDGSPNR